jgi:hypothetical protein
VRKATDCCSRHAATRKRANHGQVDAFSGSRLRVGGVPRCFDLSPCRPFRRIRLHTWPGCCLGRLFFQFLFCLLMAAFLSRFCIAKPPRLIAALDVDDKEILVQPAADLRVPRRSPRMPSLCVTSQRGPASQSDLETLPVEIVNQILSYLTHPRSRLPGLTETQSACDFPHQTRLDIKYREDLTTPADSDRWAADLFNWTALKHPFHTLSLTSKRCHDLVESYCAHRVRSCNIFNLPFAQFDQLGSRSVWPDLSGIVYRRLWLQHAPRLCIFCYAVLDNYPFPLVKRVLPCCKGCFYAQTLVRYTSLGPYCIH